MKFLSSVLLPQQRSSSLLTTPTSDSKNKWLSLFFGNTQGMQPSGIDGLRMWVASTDYAKDIMIGPSVMGRTSYVVFFPLSICCL